MDQEDSEVFNGDKANAELEGNTEQDGDTKQDGGGRGAQPTSTPMPIDVFYDPRCPEGLTIWSHKPHCGDIGVIGHNISRA